MTTVYLRVCGGTNVSLTDSDFPVGLSPRMRGNPMGGRQPQCGPRSIPAYAGEPQRAPDTVCWCWVYPRVCGGTLLLSGIGTSHAGLSPRMRGNLRLTAISDSLRRSIPAYAGEPAQSAVPSSVGKVYPRVCGGTVIIRYYQRSPRGLSPRMRGNPGLAMTG